MLAASSSFKRNQGVSLQHRHKIPASRILKLITRRQHLNKPSILPRHQGKQQIRLIPIGQNGYPFEQGGRRV